MRARKNGELARVGERCCRLADVVTRLGFVFSFRIDPHDAVLGAYLLVAGKEVLVANVADGPLVGTEAAL